MHRHSHTAHTPGHSTMGSYSPGSQFAMWCQSHGRSAVSECCVIDIISAGSLAPVCVCVCVCVRACVCFAMRCARAVSRTAEGVLEIKTVRFRQE